MSTKNSYRGINKKLVAVARKTASRAVGLAGLTKSDLPDLEQELVIAMLEGMRDYDESKCKKGTFCHLVCERRLNDILRDRTRPSNRFQFDLESLNEEIEIEEETVELIDMVDSNGEIRDNYGPWHEPERNMALRLDLETVLKSLPPDCRMICRRLKAMTVAETAKSLKIPRRTVQRKLRIIKAVFEGKSGWSI